MQFKAPLHKQITCSLQSPSLASWQAPEALQCFGSHLAFGGMYQSCFSWLGMPFFLWQGEGKAYNILVDIHAFSV